MIKNCIKCGIDKKADCFHKSSRHLDGYLNKCKDCRFIETHSMTSRARRMYADQKKSSKVRGHAPPMYSSDEFLQWCLSKDSYRKLHKEWANSGYKKNLSPSADRINDYEGYSFDNIQLMTWGENNAKHYKDRVDGVNNKVNKICLKKLFSK